MDAVKLEVKLVPLRVRVAATLEVTEGGEKGKKNEGGRGGGGGGGGGGGWGGGGGGGVTPPVLVRKFSSVQPSGAHV